MTMSKISISKATISSKLFHNLFQAVTTRGGFFIIQISTQWTTQWILLSLKLYGNFLP